MRAWNSCQKLILTITCAALIVAASASASQAAKGVRSAARSADPAAEATIVDLNRAAAAELTALPGIGPALAQRIVEYRTQNGPFKKVEDLLAVKGIGAKLLARIHDRLTIDGAAAAR